MGYMACVMETGQIGLGICIQASRDGCQWTAKWVWRSEGRMVRGTASEAVSRMQSLVSVCAHTEPHSGSGEM